MATVRSQRGEGQLWRCDVNQQICMCINTARLRCCSVPGPARNVLEEQLSF